MEFKSLDELVAYTKNKIAASMPEVGKEMKEIVKGEVNKQVYSNYAPSLYDRTYELLNAIDVSEITSNSVATEIKDSGSWFDIYSKAHAFQWSDLRMEACGDMEVLNITLYLDLEQI